MAITDAICDSFKQELLNGTHADTDTYKIALYTNAATLDKTTAVYSATNEVTGTGYTAGGVALTGRTVALSGDAAYLDFADPSWANSTITARGALIYNATKGNKAVRVLSFGAADVSDTNGTFTVQLPAPGPTATVAIA